MTEDSAAARRERDRVAAAVAAEVFRGFGVDVAEARRAGGWTNATWLAGGLALRVAGVAGSSDLLREARLAALLPPEVGYPRVVAAGEIQGHQWIATELVDAVSLDDVWPHLSPDERDRATRQTWERATAVHRIDPVAAAALARPRSPFYAVTPDEAVAGLGRLRAAGVLDAHDLPPLYRALDRFWAALPRTHAVLNHGDLSPVNALWDGRAVVSLLDFEFAVVAPVHLDLNELFKLAFAPLAQPEPPTGADRRRLQETVTELARPLLRTAADMDLLVGFSVQLETWLAERQLAKSGRTGSFERWEPCRLLTAVARADGGYFAPLAVGRS